MLDLLPPTLPLDQGERLVSPDYKRSFREFRKTVRGVDSWKLERLQHFEEVASPTREALRRGEWQEALRLFEGEREASVATARADAANGTAFRRIRVVEQPLTPYVQWELHWLRLRAEAGHPVRVLPASVVAPAEEAGPLPELTLLGGKLLFRVVYTDIGRPDGAFRFTDPGIVRRWEEYLQVLNARAEDVQTYFDREVAHLDPPPAA
ncbi:DUF6879 family protein [Streptomyces sp. B8F3]|uniref:DUF6879 family protein n=1 Tax=Streptomyces sp. B8F3 TaxID=3153573 RepID=UPI00325C3E5E